VGTRGLLLALLLLAALPLYAQSSGLSAAEEAQRVRAEAAFLLAEAEREAKALEEDARSVSAELDLLRDNARRARYNAFVGSRAWKQTSFALSTLFLAAQAHHLVTLFGLFLRLTVPHALRRAPWCQAAASAAASAAALLSRLTRRTLSRAAAAFLRATGVIPKRRRAAAPPAEDDASAQWGSWADAILDGGGGSPTSPGDPGLAQRRQNAAAAAKQVEVEARERRFAAYAAKAAEFSAGQAAAAEEETEEPGGAEEELQRLIELADGGGKGRFGFGRRKGGTTGRSFWLRVLRLPAQGGPPALVARQHRRLSALVHPDKMQHARAVDAQALLNAARDGLLETGDAG